MIRFLLGFIVVCSLVTLALTYVTVYNYGRIDAFVECREIIQGRGK